MSALGDTWQAIKNSPFTIIGYLTPVELSGRALLRDELKQDGVPTGTIPESCIHEIVEESVRAARLLAEHQRRQVHGAMMNLIQYRSSLIAEVLGFRKPHWRAMMDSDRNEIVSLLSRHGVLIATKNAENT
ncbi:MAG TPA: hypothetical protein VHU23_08590 [Rhizomicrobium sp.]|jgi:hypothetical protein|nr:hypothetical protein [Rhizomicrobium sp.]